MQLLKELMLPSKNRLLLYKVNGRGDKKRILIIATIHGDEPQGYQALNNYFKNFNKESKNDIYFVPCLNPDGMDNNTRKNSNGVDLNRNFPTKNWIKTDKDNTFYGGDYPSSELETEFIIKIINEINPDLILTLHSPYGIVNYDGPADEIAKFISEITGYPAQKDIGYPTAGSFGTYYGIEKNIPTITLEYSDNQDINHIFEISNKLFDWLIKEF